MAARSILANPVPSGTFTDRYGPRGSVPGLGDLGTHTGDDIKAPQGTPILAAHDGVVKAKWFDRFAASGAGAGGWMISITGDDGLETRYAHMLADSPLRVGQRVTRATTRLGKVGASGAATGPHLHFEVLEDGQYVDPAPYLRVTPSTAHITTDEEDGMYKPTVHVRTEGTIEWMLGHPDIGSTLAAGKSRRDGKVTIFRGFMVTTDRSIGVAWARTHARGDGNEQSRTDRAGYVSIQRELTRVSEQIHGSRS